MLKIKNGYNIYLYILSAIVILPILAPVLLQLSHTFPILEYPARVIYFIYSFSCHQFHHRSIHLFDYQIAWCARDVGIWLGILAGAITVKRNGYKGIPWYWLLPFVVPIALDGGIQTIATILGLDQGPYGATDGIWYVSNNFVRFVTGAVFGVGLGLVLSPFFKAYSSPIGYLKPKVVGIVLSLLLVVYVVFVQAWAATSTDYPPAQPLDLVVRTPAENLFIRRANGVCPTSGEDPFQLDCFF